MFCFSCGSELPASARFCPYCGTRLSDGEPAARAPAAEPPITIDVEVTDRQIRRGESILLRDACLAAPLALRLTGSMKDGTRLRLRNARVSDAYGGSGRTVIVRLRVRSDEPAPVPPTPTRVAPAPAASPYAAAARSFAPASQHCNFQLFGPSQPRSVQEGTVDIRPDGLTLYRKSAVTRVAFGAIGSAIEGRGKLFLEIPRSEILSGEKKLTKKGKLWRYELTLSGGRSLHIGYVGLSYGDAETAMDRFIAP